MIEYELKQIGRWIYLYPSPQLGLLNKIKFAFTYIKKGAQFMANPAWAKVELFQTKKCRVPIGLLYQLEQIIKDNGDNVKKIIKMSTIKDIKNGDEGAYEFQKSAFKMVVIRGGGILQIPTGGGKTRIALAVIKASKLKTLVVVPTIDLKKQWERQISSDAEVKTYQSLKFKSQLQGFGLVVFDECHNTAAKTLQRIGLNLDDNAITLGLSATPFMRNDDNLKVESIIGPVIYKISLRELINDGYLVDALVYFHKVPNDKILHRDYFETYNDFVLNNCTRNQKIVMLAAEAEGYTLVLVKLIEHGQKLYNMLKDSKQDVIFLNGSSKNRDEKMDHKIIIATSIFDEGIDIPHLETLILAGGGKSAIKTTQRIGRALRKFPGKKTAVVHDFYDDVKWLKFHSQERINIYKKDFEVTII